MKAIIMSIGSELTNGRIVDTNAAWLAGELGRRGIPVSLKLTVDDDPASIVDAWNVARSRGGLVWVTGGLGVTRDDITVETLAGALGLRLIKDEATAQRVQRSCAARGHVPSSAQMRQALVPENAEVFPNPVGLAPGLLVERDGVLLVMLPGVPAEMKAIAIESVFSRIKPFTRAAGYSTLHVGGLSESAVNESIKNLWSVLEPEEKFALQAVPGEVLLHVTVTGDKEDLCIRRAIGLADRARALLQNAGAAVYDIAFEERIVVALRSAGMSLALAESVTGGLVAFRLSEVPGASEVLRGGWITYQDCAKTKMLGIDPSMIAKYGAVSAEAAQAMATAARERGSATIAVATTGWAGPGGGTRQDPIGTVYVACSTGDRTDCERFSFSGSREIIRQHAATAALRGLLARLNIL